MKSKNHYPKSTHIQQKILIRKKFHIKLMSLEDFEIKNNKTIDDWIIQRDFIIVYHQQGADLNRAEQNDEFFFGENNEYHQIGNAYFQNDKTISKIALPIVDGDPPNPPDLDFNNGDRIKLVNNAFAYTFKGAIKATTVGSDLECKFYVGYYYRVGNQIYHHISITLTNQKLKVRKHH